jgi:hypothetical protein
MGIRKNAKFLSPTEKENYVKACVLMKADIVNPAALLADRYSRWDEYVAIHAKIQNATAPGPVTNINFGHGGVGAYSFLSWHRYFLYQFEQKLQTYVAGVTIPYWDWTDPVASNVLVASFLGPNGDVNTANIVNQGYFAYSKPGSAATPVAGSVPAMPINATPLPDWWPASLPGWRLPGMFPSTYVGGLKRSFRNPAALPRPIDIQECLAMPNYAAFQAALENGVGLGSELHPGSNMHGAMHPWVGNAVGHMFDAKVSCFDPIFYLLHSNVDRLWAMWQMDGHATEYPLAGGKPQHHRNDIMYPWIGATPGYSTQSTVAPTIPMPVGLPLKHNINTLDFRALGYSYDCIPVIGLGLDRTYSMSGLTPNPHTGMGTVTKWAAATMGVSAFLQDCETVKTSGLAYVTAGVKTFRTTTVNEFVNVFAAPGYGLIKTGSPFSKAAFDGAVAVMTPGGGTPMTEALTNIQTTLVQAPFGNLPANERRYMAFLTDGLGFVTPMSSIANGGFANTAIFAMGFGTEADVDYTMLASIVAKGITLGVTQIFHGDNAGTIDKFYENALAAAIGFTPLVDPLIELFAGEHAHLDFFATSADDCFLITAQGMDFQDINWSFVLHAPSDEILYGDERGHSHTSMDCHHCCPPPDIIVRRSNGRLTLVIQRGNAGIDCWVGKWQLMISYKASHADKMMMPDIGELMYPVSAGQIRGPRYARLLTNPKNWVATRNVFTSSQHGLDGRAASTNSSGNEACSILVNIYGRTSLKLNLRAENSVIKKGEELKIFVDADISIGSIQYHRAFVRFTAPAFDIAEILSPEKVQEIIKELEVSKECNRELDIALILAQFEKDKDLKFVIDKEGKAVSHEGGPLHVHEHDTSVPGLYHFGIYIEGAYFPGTEAKPNGHHDHGAAKMKMNSEKDMDHVTTEKGEMFTRILNITVAVV